LPNGEVNVGLLDTIVDRSFRDEEAGRVVVFGGDRRNRGYVVRSESEELRIRSFLKMFYFAEFSILLLGCWLASTWSTELNHALGRPDCHVLRSEAVSLGIYFLIVGVPFLLLWRTYKKALPGFVSVQDEVLVSGKGARRPPWPVVAGLALAVLTALAAIFFLIRVK
jgi:hypothetical protein